MVRTSLVGIAAAIAVCAGSTVARAQVGTAFTYQGQLKDAGVAVDAAADLQFSLWNAASGGSQIGSTVTSLAVPVSGGLLSTSVDFGVNPYITDQAMYLQISVRNPAGVGAYVPMTSRQRLSAAPFSLATRGMNVRASGAAGIGTPAFADNVTLALGSVAGGIPNLLFRNANNFNWGMGSFEGAGTFGDFTLTRSGLDTPYIVRGGTGDTLLNSGAGNVGIGMSTPPAVRLHVRQATNSNGIIRIDSGLSAPQYSTVGFADRGNQIWSCGLRPDGMFGIDRDGINTMLQIDQTGRVGIGGAVPTGGRQLNVAGGAFCTGAVWTNACDKNLKEDFVEVNSEEILNKVANMDITTWRYKGTDKVHMGPTAQDFRAAFGLGENDTSIGTVDADGVSLAAIKGLNARLLSKDATINDLKVRLEKLEALVAAQAAK